MAESGVPAEVAEACPQPPWPPALAGREIGPLRGSEGPSCERGRQE